MRRAATPLRPSTPAIASPLWHNDGDNEITGIHVSDGDPTPAGLFGAAVPTPFAHGWRFFYTQQHGDNVTYEITPKSQESRQTRTGSPQSLSPTR